MVVQMVTDTSTEVQELEYRIAVLDVELDEARDERRYAQHECDAHVAVLQNIQFILSEFDHAEAFGYADRMRESIAQLFATVDTHANEWTSLAIRP